MTYKDAAKPFVKTFSHNGCFYVFDVNTSRVVEVDETVYTIIDDYVDGDLSRIEAQYRDHFSPARIKSAVEKIRQSKNEQGLFSNFRPRKITLGARKPEHIEEIHTRGFRQMLLELTGECTLNCRYCSTRKSVIEKALEVYTELLSVDPDCLKVFERTGKYIRTIGRRGRGPGDVFQPLHLALSPEGDLVVSEGGGYRIQRFDPLGKSEKIIKVKNYVRWLGVTSEDRLVVNDHYNTLKTRNLLSIWDDNGKTIKEIDAYHDKVKDFMSSDKLCFAMDDSYNIYTVNSKAPVIRKYAPDGTMIMAITFTPPFEVPVKISLNDRGDEITKEGEWNLEKHKTTTTKRGNSIAIQVNGKVRKVVLCRYIDIDTLKRTYIVTPNRIRTLDEIKKGPQILSSSKFFKVLNRKDAKARRANPLSSQLPNFLIKIHLPIFPTSSYQPSRNLAA